jgi:hypothetical protein
MTKVILHIALEGRGMISLPSSHTRWIDEKTKLASIGEENQERGKRGGFERKKLNQASALPTRL